MRTYTTGLSLKHFSQNDRGSVKKRLAAIVKQLSNENTKHCQKHAHQVVNHLIDQDIDNHCIMDPIANVNGGKGKYGVNELMKNIGNAKNHLHSGYHQLLTSCKGYIDRVNKVSEIFEFMNDNPTEFISWILWQRSTYTNRVFAKKWNVKFWYVDNLMRGVHNSYFGNIDNTDNTLPCFVRDPSEKEVLDAIDMVLSGFNNDFNDLTDRQKAFVNKLKKLKKLKTIGSTDSMDPMDLSFIPTGWKHLKMWVDNLDFHRSWMPVFRSILSQVYLLDYKGMINKIKTAKVTELLRIPFQKSDERKNNKNNKNKNNYKNKLSYQMVSGPKYVIRRENNTKSLDLMRKQGFFILQFKFLEDKWKDAIAVRVRPSRKMRVIIYNNKDIILRSMVVLAPRSNDVDIQLIFEGETEDFISTDHLKKRIAVNKVDTIGIDINRRGEYAVVSNLDVELPGEIVEQSRRWDVVLDKISHLQYLQDKTDNSWRKSIYGFQIGDLHNRKKNLRKDYHLRLANWVGLQMVSSGADKLVIEDLDIRTYGTRGALAKAIESMADNTSLYAREILAVRKFTGKYIELVKRSAHNSSKIHVDCGGRLKRDYSKNHYDIAPCSECRKMVNTHKNAAIYLVNTLSGPQNPDRL